MEQLEGWFEVHALWYIKFKFCKTYVFKITKVGKQLLPWIFFSDSEFVLNEKKTVFSSSTACLRLVFVQVYISFNAFLQFLAAPMPCKSQHMLWITVLNNCGSH